MRMLLVVTALLAAGCAGPVPDEAGGMDAGTGATVTSSMTAAPTPAALASVPEPVAEAFTWSGHTKEGAWVCMEQDGAGQCPAGQQLVPDGQYLTMLAYNGSLSAVELTVTWQADPTQTGLVLAVFGNTTSGRAPLGLVQGDSPLQLRIESGESLVRDGQLMLMVWPEGKTPTSPSVFVDVTQQPFIVEGTLFLVR